MLARLSLVVAALLTASCAAPEKDARSPFVEEPALASYELATSAADLSRMLEDDLDAQRGEAAFRGLEAFTQKYIKDGHATRGLLVFRAAEPVTLFLFSDARQYMNSVKELEKMLASKARRDLDQAYHSIRVGDEQGLAALRSDPRGLLHPDTLALSPELRPHATLVEALSAYGALGPRSSGAEVDTVLDQLTAARRVLVHIDRPEALFLADVATAQSLEQAGRSDEAAEVWLMVADSPFWPDAPPALRNAIAARIVTYRDRLKDALSVQLEEERRAELRGLHDQYASKLTALRAEHAELDAWVRSADAENDAALRRLASTDAYIQSELERLDREAQAASDEHTASIDGATARDALALTADIFSVMQPARRLLRLR